MVFRTRKSDRKELLIKVLDKLNKQSSEFICWCLIYADTGGVPGTYGSLSSGINKLSKVGKEINTYINNLLEDSDTLPIAVGKYYGEKLQPETFALYRRFLLELMISGTYPKNIKEFCLAFEKLNKE